MTLTNKSLSPASFLVLATLLACGGGGGGSTPPPVPAVAPSISTQPASQTVNTGAAATFSVTATGTAPLSYQWNKGGTAITSATSTSFNLAAAALTDSGSYTVTVSNAAGSITSSAAVLTVQALATSLAYVDPTTGTYLLKKNVALSTATHLVLDLVGPAATTGTGVLATLSADTAKVTWVNVAATDATNTFVQNGTAFTLGVSPQLLKGKVNGNVLQAAVAQKGTGLPVALNAPLLRVALDLKASQPAGAITFTADNTKCQVLDGSVTSPTGITVAVGTLSAQ
jgi:hypothetical protein